jgi:transposase
MCFQQFFPLLKGRWPMPRPKVFTVGLADGDREMLTKVVTTGTHSAQLIRRARVLLELDENAGPVPDRAVVADRVGVSEETVRQIAKRFVQSGGDVEATITRKEREAPPVPSVVTGEVEARVIALACSAPPDGYARWSLRLLEKKIALIEDVPDLDHSTIGRVLKKRNFVLI